MHLPGGPAQKLHAIPETAGLTQADDDIDFGKY